MKITGHVCTRQIKEFGAVRGAGDGTAGQHIPQGQTVGEQQLSCNIKAIANMLRMMRVASDCDDFSAGVLVHFQDICMRMREGETAV